MDKSYVGKKVTVQSIENPADTYIGKVTFFSEKSDGTYSASISFPTKGSNLTVTNETESLYGIEIVEDKPILPDEYQQVEWVESHRESQSVGAYIDTGVVGNQDFGFEIKFVKLNGFSTSSTAEYGCIFGGRHSSATNEIQLTTWYAPESDNKGTFGWRNSRTNAGMIDDKTSIQVATLHNKKYKAPNGIVTDLSDYNFATPTTITIFGLHNYNTQSVVQYGDVRLYSFKMYSGSQLVRNFIPCYRKADGEVGLYDIVGKQFYYNQSGHGYLSTNKVFIRETDWGQYTISSNSSSAHGKVGDTSPAYYYRQSPTRISTVGKDFTGELGTYSVNPAYKLNGATKVSIKCNEGYKFGLMFHNEELRSTTVPVSLSDNTSAGDYDASSYAWMNVLLGKTGNLNITPEEFSNIDVRVSYAPPALNTALGSPLLGTPSLSNTINKEVD